MKIDKIVEQNTLPSGPQTVVPVSHRTCCTEKWGNIISRIPHGEARTRSLYTGYHTVILATDAAKYGIPTAGVGNNQQYINID